MIGLNHIYSDSTFFRYEIELTRNDEESGNVGQKYQICVSPLDNVLLAFTNYQDDFALNLPSLPLQEFCTNIPNMPIRSGSPMESRITTR